MANKMTQKDYFNEIITLAKENGRDDLVAFCNDRIDKLSRKSSSKKPTKTQLENDGFKAEIVAYLTEADAPKTIRELQAEIPSISGLTNQRITHMLTDLIKDEVLVKEYVKKVPYYSVA